jgi:outer membrane protein assembly factor BamB/serine/threonine protein kinase
MPDRIGQQLGNYQLLHLLGEGGFAEVYLGEHIHLGTQAAIKVLHTQLTSEDVNKFRTEARTIASLIHPHIVRVLEFGIEGKTPFLVMDYASNGTLRQRHPKDRALPLSLIVAYVKQVADALQYAHDEKVIHRDVKPANMLLGRRNEILLSDFGIALVAQSSRYQSAQEMAGTMAYMAPEQIQGKPRPASDQYSLGIAVYEWLTGDRPFHGSLTELVGQHLSVPPASLREKVSTISPEVDRVVLTALAKDPKQRFDSIQTMAFALYEAAQLPPSMETLNSTIEAQRAAPATPLEPVSQPPSGAKPEALVRALTDRESAHIEPVTQTADVPPFIQHSTAVPHSSPQDPLRNAASRSSHKRRPSRRFSLLMGGTLGLISLLVVLVIIIEPVMSIQRGPSATPSSSATSTHPDHISQKWAFPTGDAVDTSPTVVNGVVYVGSKKVVYALDASTGQQKWAFPTGFKAYSSPTVVIVNGVVYVGSDKAYAIDASTGQQKWAFTTGIEVYSSQTVVNGVVYVCSDKMYAVDASTGQQKWAFRPLYSGAVSTSPTVVNGNGVVYINETGIVYAVDASTGQQIWTFTTDEPANSSTVSFPLTLVNGVVYVGTDKMYALDASTGQKKWTFPTGGAVSSTPTVVNGVVYVSSKTFSSDVYNMYALDASTGQKKWTFPTGGAVASTPTVVNGMLYVGSFDHNVYALDASTGQKKWTFPTGGAVVSSPTVVDGVLYVGSWDSKVYALDASTGQKKWTFTTSNTVSSTPTVVNGVVYVGSNDNNVYALTLPESSS